METDQPEPADRLPEYADAAEGVALRTQVAQLRAEVVRLEAALDRERRRRQTMINRYEKLLRERDCDCTGERRGDGPLRRLLK
ncbi:hypothetical protein G9464_01395 [Halostella sp. JP-L12]|uniref:hypothetical protein n=1 Tax=Halostella TaxID=1843185 RepID=UPI000EF83C21|nr:MULTISPECIES: hypothetical protein [Halostella]NHN46255.1 hypothetical protein [Halostella sp. JP-L12]